MGIKANVPSVLLSVEPDEVTRYKSPVGPTTSSSTREHIEPNESPDDGPPIAHLVSSKPHSEDGQNALKYGSSRYERKRRIVATLLDRDRERLACRVASCGNDQKRCGHPHLCRMCLQHKRFDAKRRHADWVKTWDHHSLIALTMPSTREHPVVARADVRKRFQSFRRRAGVRDLVSYAFGGIHTVSDRENPDWYRSHLDLLIDSSVDRDFRNTVVEEWTDLGGGHVETAELEAHPDGTYEDAIEATTCYVVEKTTGLSACEQVDYATVRPGGEGHWFTVGNI